MRSDSRTSGFSERGSNNSRQFLAGVSEFSQ